MQYEILASQNPWWKGKERIEEDEDYRKWKEKRIKWIPPLVERLSLEPYSLHFVFGPRQVGKSTLLKLVIKRLLDKGARAESIFYFKCDKISDYKELDELLSAFFELREKLGLHKCYFFLDEITFPKEWYRTIKFYIDDGKFRNDVLVLTGSTSFFAKKETEFFPGRRGKGKNFILLPLSFRSFVKVIKPALFKKLPAFSSLDKEEIRKKIFPCLPFIDELNRLLKDYMRCGGFPLSLQSYFEKKETTKDVFDTYLSWLQNDITKIGRDVNIARSIIKTLLTKFPSPISWEGISKEIEIKSPKTVNAYLHLLKSLFVLLILYHIDPNNASVNFGKNKKIHFVDPFFYHLFSEWCLQKIQNIESIMAESLVASHLSRLSDIFYWRNKDEIDVVTANGGLKGFEVKWTEKAEARTRIIGKIKQVIFITKSFVSEPPNIPLSAFLACLDVE